MGGSLGGAFNAQPQGQNNQPSALQQIVQGSIKGAMQNAGQGMQVNPYARGGGGGGMIQPPAATPVDPNFFAPMLFPGVG